MSEIDKKILIEVDNQIHRLESSIKDFKRQIDLLEHESKILAKEKGHMEKMKNNIIQMQP